MSKQPAATFEVDCPCCRAKLSVDRELGAVLSHVPPPRPPSSVDLDDTARLLRGQTEAVEAKFRASVEAEKSKEDVLARKFAEGLKKAKDGPIEKPLRDFDLDWTPNATGRGFPRAPHASAGSSRCVGPPCSRHGSRVFFDRPARHFLAGSSSTE